MNLKYVDIFLQVNLLEYEVCVFPAHFNDNHWSGYSELVIFDLWQCLIMIVWKH